MNKAIELLKEIYWDKVADSGDRGSSICRKIDTLLYKEYGIDLDEEEDE